MSDFAKKLIGQLDNISTVAKAFDSLVAQVKKETGQSTKESRADVAARIAERRQQNAPSLTVYERILSDVANGRRRPKNFDATGR